jgi:predicted nucleic acid-binding protein
MAWKRVVNSSPLIFLTRIGLLELLSEPGVSVIVPDADLAELGAIGPNDPAAVAVESTRWIEVVSTPPIPDSLRQWSLGAGEASVLSLAIAEIESGTANAHEIDVVLDDRKARRCATGLGLGEQGTLALLLIAKKTGRINAVHPLLLRLRSGGMHISTELMLRVLSQAGE